MRTASPPPRRRGPETGSACELAEALESRIVGQREAVEEIVPYVQMYQAGLSPEGRPAGVFLLLGPSGTGKTKTVEALAEVLHASERNLLRIDCGEFQMEHEVAKLIGAPPGYLGHRETHPMLSQAKLNAVTSEHSSLSIVLLDEIEKAAPSMTRLLLGVLDKATLRLGDNTSVNFERSIIFMTSNLGAREMLREIRPGFGFQPMSASGGSGAGGKLRSIGVGAVRRHFTPEFVNRLDSIVTYRPLEAGSLARILSLQLAALQSHIIQRLGPRGFRFRASDALCRFLLAKGTSPEFGARELKRVIHRCVLQPLAGVVAAGGIEPGSSILVDVDDAGQGIRLVPDPEQAGPDEPRPAPVRRRAA